MPGPELSAYKILYVDSDSDSVKRAEAILMMTGIRNARICRNADEALKEFQTGYRPDVALIAPDLKNGIHGIQLIKKIRESFETAKGKEIPILLLVSRLDKAMLRHACRTGVEGAIRKPLDHAKIGRIILAAIKKPRRFIAVRDYFGPERRFADDPAYSGPERRTALGEHETVATKARRDEQPKKPPALPTVAETPKQTEPKKTKEPALLKDPNVTPISEYELPESRVDKVAVKPKGGKIVADDEPLAKPEKPKPVAQPKPVEKPQPVAKPKPSAPPATPVEKPKPVAQKPAAKPKQEDKGVETVAPAKPDKPKEEAPKEVEIVDIDEALRNHRLWVDSAGREGEAIVVKRANLRGADLEAADLTGVSLIQGNFTEAKMAEIILRKANLTGAVFVKANLTGANLAVARLRQANLVGARLDRAILRGADLSGAKFKGASLLRTDLSSANLAQADLSGANLSAAIGLIQEQVDRAYLDSKTALPNGLKVNPAALARSTKAGLVGLKSKATKQPAKR